MKAKGRRIVSAAVFVGLFLLFVIVSTPDVGLLVVRFCYERSDWIFRIYGAIIAALFAFKAYHFAQAKGKHVVAPSGVDFLGPLQRLLFDAISMFFSFTGATTILMLSYLGKMPSEIGPWGLAFVNLTMAALIGWNAVKIIQWIGDFVFKPTAEIIDRVADHSP